MTSEQVQVCNELWREALAAGLVRWMPGMLARAVDPLPGIASGPMRVLSTTVGRPWGAYDYDPDWPDAEGEMDWCYSAYVHGAAPDWTDPATTGCLLALAREATGDPWLHAVLSGPFMGGADWTTRGRGSRFVTGGICAHTEPEALLRAILATRGE